MERHESEARSVDGWIQTNWDMIFALQLVDCVYGEESSGSTPRQVQLTFYEDRLQTWHSYSFIYWPLCVWSRKIITQISLFCGSYNFAYEPEDDKNRKETHQNHKCENKRDESTISIIEHVSTINNISAANSTGRIQSHTMHTVPRRFGI